MIPFNIRRLLTATVVVLILVYCVFQCRGKRTSKEQVKSYKSLNTSKTIKTFIDEKGDSHARTETSTILTAENLVHDDLEEIKSEFADLRPDLKNLEASNKTYTKTITKVVTVVKDSIVYRKPRDGLIRKDSVQILRYNDNKGNELNGVIRGGEFVGEFSTTDTIKTVVYWERKCFICKKKYISETKSSNPSTNIVHHEAIVVKKKRKRFLGIF